jgi:hypothetical protein
MVEYGVLKLLELGGRLDAQLVREQSPVVLERVKGLGGAARAVQGDDELPTKPIAQRLLGYQLTEFTDDKRMVTGREVRLDPALKSGPAQFLQPLRFRDSEGLRRKLAEGRTTPQCQRASQLGAGDFRAPRMRGPGLRELLFEQFGVDAHGIQTQAVPVRSGLDRPGAKDATKLSHVRAKNRIGRSRGLVSP